MSTKRLLSILAALALVVSACSGDTTDTTRPEGVEDITLTMWTHDQLYIDYFLEKAQEWEAQWPQYNITYDFQQIPAIDDAILTAIAAGEELPDLYGLEIGTFPRFMRDGIIAEYFIDLTDLIGERRELFVEGRWTPYSYEGRLYGVESALTASAYYHQPAIFEQHGVEVPTTWEEFLATGEQMAGEGVALSVMSDDSQGQYHMLFIQRGGVSFDETGEFVLGEPENRSIAIDVAEFVQRGVESGVFFVVLGGEFWGGSIPSAFAEGRLAGIAMPDWYAGCCLKPGVEDMAGEWRVAPLPVWEAGGHTTTVWGGTAFTIPKATEHPDVAWSLLEFAYLTLDGQLDRYDAIGFYPTMHEALDHPRVTEAEDPFFGGQSVGEVFAEVALDTPGYYQSANRAFFLTALNENLPLLFDGTLTPEEFVDEVIAITENEIALSS